jgi:Ca2+-binding RTX toxin-like protein
MATFILTPAPNNFTGTPGADLFRGFGGGFDVLRGMAGNDTFDIKFQQRGLIDGGLGIDRIIMQGHNQNTFHSGLTIRGVENLFVHDTNVYGTAAQFNSFTHIIPINASTEFNINLQGRGGLLDLTTKYASPKHLEVDAELALSGVTVFGSARGDEISGSDFNDRLFGGGGADTVRGQAGNDIVGGGLGRDFLEGGDGRDSFLFNVAPTSANFDHLMDFRPTDDTIRLENAVFPGMAAGPLAPAFFKDLAVAPRDANDKVLYNSDTGRLLVDSDGSGPRAAALVGILDNFAGDIPTLTAADFLIV